MTILPTCVVALFCVSQLAVAGCKKSDTATKERPSLLKEGELEEMRTGFAAIASENAAKVCKRPLLRPGSTLEGNADKDILALLAEEGVMQPCYAELKTLEASIEDTEGVLALLLDFDRRAQTLDSRSGLTADQEASLAALPTTCEQLPMLLSKAVSHPDACSPYLPGRRGLGAMLPFLAITKAALLVSQKLAAEGERLKATQLLLDTMRLGQDLRRGGTSLLEPMLTYASHRMIRPVIDQHFDSLTLDELRLIDTELGVLIASHPHYSEHFEGDRNNIVMESVWPMMEPQGWVPPGGHPHGRLESDAPDPEEDGGPTIEERAMLAWVVVRENARAQKEKCSASVPLRSCLLALDQLLDSWSEEAKPELATLFHMVASSDDNAHELIRKEIIKILQGVATPDLGKYYLRIETMRIALLAQRNKVQSLMASKEGQPCPVPLVGQDKESLPQVDSQDDEFYFRLPQWMVDRAARGSETEHERASETLVRLRCV